MNDAQHPTNACLDAETIAAWLDGGLSGEALTIARTHVADCARCQAVVAVMVRTEAAAAAPAAERPSRRWLGWLVPLAAAATAVAIWVAVPGARIPSLSPALKEEAAPVAQSEPTQQAADLKAQAAPPASPAEGRRDAVIKNEAQSDARNQEKKQAKERDEAARSNKLTDQFARISRRPRPRRRRRAASVDRVRRALGQAAARAVVDSLEIASAAFLCPRRVRAAQVEKTSTAARPGTPLRRCDGRAHHGRRDSASVCWLASAAGASSSAQRMGARGAG